MYISYVAFGGFQQHKQRVRRGLRSCLPFSAYFIKALMHKAKPDAMNRNSPKTNLHLQTRKATVVWFSLNK